MEYYSTPKRMNVMTWMNLENYAKWKGPNMGLFIKLFITGNSLDTESKLVGASGCGEKGNRKWPLPDNRAWFWVASSGRLDSVMTSKVTPCVLHNTGF